MRSYNYKLLEGNSISAYCSCWVQRSRTYIGSRKSAEPVGLAVQKTVEFKLVIILKTGKTLRLKR